MIVNIDGESPIGTEGYNAILGGIEPDSNTFRLSAYFLLPYSYEETIKPKWWQIWKKPVVNIIESERWQRKSCVIYAWQVRAISCGDLDVEKNEKLQTLIFVLGGGCQFFWGVTLEALTTHTNYVGSSVDFTSTEWSGPSAVTRKTDELESKNV